MRACIRKVRWLSMENTVPSGRGEFKPVETPPAAVEAGSPRLKSWEEVTFFTFLLPNCPDLPNSTAAEENGHEECKQHGYVQHCDG